MKKLTAILIFLVTALASFGQDIPIAPIHHTRATTNADSLLPGIFVTQRGTGTNVTLLTSPYINVTNLSVIGTSWLNSSNLNVYLTNYLSNANFTIPIMTASNAPSGLAIMVTNSLAVSALSFTNWTDGHLAFSSSIFTFNGSAGHNYNATNTLFYVYPNPVTVYSNSFDWSESYSGSSTNGSITLYGSTNGLDWTSLGTSPFWFDPSTGNHLTGFSFANFTGAYFRWVLVSTTTFSLDQFGYGQFYGSILTNSFNTIESKNLTLKIISTNGVIVNTANSVIINATNGVAINTNNAGTNALEVAGNVDSTVGFTVNGLPLSQIPSSGNYSQLYVTGGGGVNTNFDGIYTVAGGYYTNDANGLYLFPKGVSPFGVSFGANELVTNSMGNSAGQQAASLNSFLGIYIPPGDSPAGNLYVAAYNNPTNSNGAFPYTTVTSSNATVAITPSLNPNGSSNYDLSVSGGGSGGGTNTTWSLGTNYVSLSVNTLYTNFNNSGVLFGTIQFLSTNSSRNYCNIYYTNNGVGYSISAEMPQIGAGYNGGFPFSIPLLNGSTFIFSPSSLGIINSIAGTYWVNGGGGGGGSATNISGGTFSNVTLTANSTVPTAGTATGITNLPTIFVYPNGTLFYGGVYYPQPASETCGIQEAINLLPLSSNNVPPCYGGGNIILAQGIFFTATNIYTPNTTNHFIFNLSGQALQTSGIVYTNTTPMDVLTIGNGLNPNSRNNLQFSLKNMFFAEATNACTNIVHINGGNAVKGTFPAVGNGIIDGCWFGYWQSISNGLPDYGEGNLSAKNNLIGLNIECEDDDDIIVQRCFFNYCMGISLAADHVVIQNNYFAGCGYTGYNPTTNDWPATSIYSVNAAISCPDAYNGNNVWGIYRNDFIFVEIGYSFGDTRVATGAAMHPALYDDYFEDGGGALVAYVVTTGAKVVSINPQTVGQSFVGTSYFATNYNNFSTWANNIAPTNMVNVIDFRGMTNMGSMNFGGNVSARLFTGNGSGLTNTPTTLGSLISGSTNGAPAAAMLVYAGDGTVSTNALPVSNPYSALATNVVSGIQITNPVIVVGQWAIITNASSLIISNTVYQTMNFMVKSNGTIAQYGYNNTAHYTGFQSDGYTLTFLQDGTGVASINNAGGLGVNSINSSGATWASGGYLTFLLNVQNVLASSGIYATNGFGTFNTNYNTGATSAGYTNSTASAQLINIIGTSGSYVYYVRGGKYGGTACATPVFTNSILAGGDAFNLGINDGVQVISGVGVSIQLAPGN